MAVRVKTDQVVKKLQDAFKNAAQKNELYIDIINFATERIRQRARLSKRMIENQGEVSLPELSDSYRKKRSKISPGQKGTDAQFFRPNKSTSNLTFTGQLLKSLIGRILKKGPDVGKIELEFDGTRKDGLTNKQVYKDLTQRDEGYSILTLDKKAIERIQNICLNRLRQELIRLKLK